MEMTRDHHAVNVGIMCPDCGRHYLYVTLAPMMDGKPQTWPDAVVFDIKKAPKLICPCGWSIWGTVTSAGTYRFDRADLED